MMFQPGNSMWYMVEMRILHLQKEISLAGGIYMINLIRSDNHVPICRGLGCREDKFFGGPGFAKSFAPFVYHTVMRYL